MFVVKKKVYCMVLFSLLATNIWAASAETSTRRNMEISINPLALLLGGLNASYRFAVSHDVALGLHLDGLFFSLTKELAATGIGGGLSAKFFLTRDAFSDGWYIEPAFHTSNLGFGSADKFWRISPQVIAGYGWVWPKGFSLNLGLGVVYNHAFGARDPGYLYKGFFPAGEFSIGWAW